MLLTVGVDRCDKTCFDTFECFTSDGTAFIDCNKVGKTIDSSCTLILQLCVLFAR